MDNLVLPVGTIENLSGQGLAKTGLTVVVWVVEGRLLVTTSVLLGSDWSVGSCTPACPHCCVSPSRQNTDMDRRTDKLLSSAALPFKSTRFLQMNESDPTRPGRLLLPLTVEGSLVPRGFIAVVAVLSM